MTELAARESASRAEINAAFSGPSVAANKILLTLTPVTGRLTFLEIHPDVEHPQFRASVSLLVSDLLSLRDLLDRMLANVEALPLEAEKNASSE